MSPPKKYSFPYRVYRKMRYLRYVSRLRKAEYKAYKNAEKEEKARSRQLARAQKKIELAADSLKRKHEKQAIRETRRKLLSDHLRDQEDNREKYEKQLQQQLAAIKKEKQFRRYRRRRLARFFIKTFYRKILQSLRTLNPANLPFLLGYIRDNRFKIREFTIITVHSTLLFMAAYFTVFLIMLATAAVSGAFFDYTAIIYYHEVMWLVKPEEWYQDSVQMIFASGPILCGILAFFIAIVYSYLYSGSGIFKLFVLWLLLHAFNAFFGSVLIGSFFSRGFGYALIWTYISDTEKVIYSIVSILSLFLLGVFTIRSFLVSANTYYPHLEDNSQQRFIWAQALLPFLLGNLLIVLIMLPEFSWFNFTVAASLFISMIPIGIGYRFMPSLYFEEEKPSIKLNYIVVAMVLTFIALYRIILGIGIKIG